MQNMRNQKPTLARLIDRFPAVKILLGVLYGMFGRFTQATLGSVLRSGPHPGQASLAKQQSPHNYEP